MDRGSVPALRRPVFGRVGARPLVALAVVAGVLAIAGPRPLRAGPGEPPARPNGVAFAADTSLRGQMVPTPSYRPKEFAFVEDQGVFHIFYMRHKTFGPDDLTEKDIGHAVSLDLYHWTNLDSVMLVQPGTWDSSHVWAPTLIKRGDTWYMYYAGVGNVPYAWPWYQRIGVATSTDLMSWTRYDQPVYGGQEVPWAFADSSQFDGCQFRDPFVMEDPDQPGQWLLYYVTEPAAARGQLIVGAARGDGGFSPWTDVGPLWCTDAAHYWGWCESPNLFEHAGLWFLFVTTPSGHPVSFRTAPSPLADSSLWSGKYRLFDYAGGASRNSDAWYATEILSYRGHDYFAYVDSDYNVIAIEEMHWGAPPNFFTLGAPLVDAVARAPRPAPVGIRLVGRARRGSGALLAVSLDAPADVRLDLFDVAGRLVHSLRPGVLSAGETLLRWDGRGPSGAAVPCAMYFARATVPAGSRTTRLPLTD